MKLGRQTLGLGSREGSCMRKDLSPHPKKSSTTWVAIPRQLLGLPPAVPQTPELSTRDLLLELTGKDPQRCPCCQRGTLVIVEHWPAAPAQFLSWQLAQPP